MLWIIEKFFEFKTTWTHFSLKMQSVKEGIYTAFNVTAPWTVQADWKCSESGQFLFDRQKHTDVLEWTLFVNAHHETSYKYIYGDKDTFEFAFHLAGKAQQYRRIGYGPRASFKRVKEVSWAQLHLSIIILPLPFFWKFISTGLHNANSMMYFAMYDKFEQILRHRLQASVS